MLQPRVTELKKHVLDLPHVLLLRVGDVEPPPGVGLGQARAADGVEHAVGGLDGGDGPVQEALDEPGRAREAASRAKLQVATAGRHIGEEAIQLHGGIGMTAEYAVGHYTARLTALEHLLGDGRAQTAKLVEQLGTYETVDPLD